MRVVFKLRLEFVYYYRYPPHGRRAVAIENGVPWERLRAPPVDTPPHDLHISDCLNDLRPGDHVEIQWRRNKEFPYGLFFKLSSLLLFFLLVEKLFTCTKFIN